MKLKFKMQRVIQDEDWDAFVRKVYKKPYCFQQQNGCHERGTAYLTVPCPASDYENDSVPEEINGREMGVSFKAWLERDVKKPVGEEKQPWSIELFWHRNFYPDIQMVANDLHKKGLLDAGEYLIIIDW